MYPLLARQGHTAMSPNCNISGKTKMNGSNALNRLRSPRRPTPWRGKCVPPVAVESYCADTRHVCACA